MTAFDSPTMYVSRMEQVMMAFKSYSVQICMFMGGDGANN